MSDTLLAALKTNNLQEAKSLLENSETLPAGLSDNEYLQLLDKLLRDSAFDLIRLLLKVKPVETDIYVYDSFTGTFFEKLFFYIKNNEQAISFLDDFLTTIKNLNEDLMGLTLLGFAIEKAADPAVIKSLVKAGSDVTFVNNAEENLLHIIVKTNRMKPEIALAYLEYIIAEGVDVNAADIELKTPLHSAINGNRVEMIDMLLENGADANAQNKTGESAFYLAVIHQQNYPVYLKLRETVLPDFEQQTKDGQRLLFEFVRRLDRPTPALLELLGKLIEDGADLLQTSVYYQKEKTAIAAAAEQKFEVFNQIISLNSIDVNSIHEDGNTLLHKVSSNNDQSPVWYACTHNQKEIVSLFLQNGIDVNYSKPLSGSDESMNSYLDWIEVATNISIDSTFNLNDTYAFGAESLLHVAVKKGHLSMVKLLIENDATVNIQDESGNTPLHYAAANGKKDIVKFLLEQHAAPSIVNVKEQKAIDYSNIKGFNEITEVLLKYSPKDSFKGAEFKGNTPETSDQNVASATESPLMAKKQALLDLKELLDAGILTQEEFNAEKAKVLQ